MKSLSEVRKALVVRPDEIGDVVLTTAFLRELRHNLPKAWICLVVKPVVYNLVEYCPYINELVTYRGRSRYPLGRLQGAWPAYRFTRKKLRSMRFDLAIVPRYDADYYHATYIAYFSGAARRVGYSEKVTPAKQRWNRGYDRLLTDVLTSSESKHEAGRNLDVLRFLGGEIREERTELWLRPEDRFFAERLFESENIRPDQKAIAIGPGAAHPKRRWPIENFVQLGQSLVKNADARLVVVGSDADGALATELQSRLGNAVINLAGHSTLRETAAVLEKCSLFVGNDTGPVHLAAAVGTPVAVVSCHPKNGSPDHANSPVRFGPWKVPHRVVQPDRAESPCVDGCEAPAAHCIRHVSIESVKSAIDALVYERAI